MSMELADEGEMEKIVPSALNAGSDTGTLVQVSFQKNPYQTQKYLEGEPKALGITEIMLSVFFLSTIAVDCKYLDEQPVAITRAIFSLANIVAGSVAIAAQNLHLPTLKACLGMQVVACVLSGVSFIMSTDLMANHSLFRFCWSIPDNDTLGENMCVRQWNVHELIIGIDMIMLLAQIALSATLAAFCCKVIQCCSPRNNVPVVVVNTHPEPQLQQSHNPI
ncbi:membrane-spanning 4-domains subfamily A member 4A-like [Clarias magur]|uniref:Membrane-spanning 4-domains subfamily A member 4A-like n=1 Tax=Clarias magur TaxID=1594786 RepID=A0A8J4XEX2_CLAMG|nr:membrane-spanning 4-domains subfamily A member 4A-like [Clarias magur]